VVAGEEEKYNVYKIRDALKFNRNGSESRAEHAGNIHGGRFMCLLSIFFFCSSLLRACAHSVASNKRKKKRKEKRRNLTSRVSVCVCVCVLKTAWKK
jgi:hypothetical protein